MESQISRWSAPSLARHKPVILALTAVALGCSLYYIRDQIWSSTEAPKPALRRSNARRQQRRARSGPPTIILLNRRNARYLTDAPWGSTPVSDLGFLGDGAGDDDVLAHHFFRLASGETASTPLTRHLPSVEDMLQITRDRDEAALFRRELEEGFLIIYFWLHLPPSQITEADRDLIVQELERDGGFSATNVTTALAQHQERRLTESIEQWEQLQRRRRNPEGNWEDERLSRQEVAMDRAHSTIQALEGRETVTDDNSEHSWRGERETVDGDEAGKEGQSLLNLLYRIAEEQARKDGYVHRRVTCNACNIMPIRGIRYHCANCLDYDLCEQCEALQIHPRTHLFYKIRIPAPFIRNPRQPEPVWYPGRPAAVNHNLEKETMTMICKETGYQVAEVEALWEQFRCLAATEWLGDPSRYYLAIDRRTFDKCFVPHTSLRPPPPNLIYDRMFSFYDQNNDGLIGFLEFINGLASLTKKNMNERQKRIFKGYDTNNDGFVDRKDFLRMFRAYYALTKELTRDVLASMEDDVSESGARDIVLGSQPISSAFAGAIPRGESSRAGEGKVQDDYGDYRVLGDMGAIDEKEHDLADPEETLADATLAQIGDFPLGKNCGFLYNESWPPEVITLADVAKVLGEPIPPPAVTLPEDQKAILRVTHARLANCYQKHSFLRRQAIRDRKQRRAFYLDGEDNALSPGSSDPTLRESTASAPLDLARRKNLNLLSDAGKADRFYARLAQRISELEWPVLDSPKELARNIGELIILGWTGTELAEDLSGYVLNSNASTELVVSISNFLEELVKELGPQNTIEEPIGSFPSSRRSRSSSKVRFQDDVGTDDGHESRSRATSLSSRSIPMNERWGGFEVPEPEKDVGREVLYQVTREALNELLDPVFRLREDLALSALQTKSMRVKYRAETAASVKEKDMWVIKNLTDAYQKRWRSDPFTRNENSCDTDHPCDWDEAATFLEFLNQRDAGDLNKLTTEECSSCAEKGQQTWLLVGQEFCLNCTKFTRYYMDEPTPEESCPRCAEEGRKSVIGGSSGGICCCNCGQGSTQYIAETSRLQAIISGHRSQPFAREVQVADARATNSDSTQEPSNPPSLETVLDLDGSVTVFDQAYPPSVEQGVAQRPLNNLLADSGYAVADTPQGTSSSPSLDPTLPQNRPNHIPLPDLGIQKDGPGGISTSPDPTLPQNRPTRSPEEYVIVGGDPLQRLRIISSEDIPTGHPPAQAEEDDDFELPPDLNTLKYYAALDLLEAEDKDRGGPGRLSFKEWLEVMKGEKGKMLGFLGTWIEMATF